ncbi:MAG: transcription termination/antitermination protein NusG [Bacteroidales bacterium]|jgi:transcriptional antiterminator NusG|nr:transcription termination/antitermination protein NusG [Bacteroidales bacterium]
MTEVEKKWYVIRAVTGTEKKTKQNIENEVVASNIKEYVTRVLIPTEKFYQMRNGKKISKERNFFPGYVFVEAIMVGEVQSILLSIPGVLGFVGCKHKIDPPVALRSVEVTRMLGKVDELLEQDETFAPPFMVGEEIKVIDGPFNSFNGIIEEINTEKKKLKIMVKIFGRKTPLELSFMQVEKL